MKQHRFQKALGWLVVSTLAFAGCSAAPAELQEVIEQVAPTIQAAASDLAPAVEAVVDESAPAEEVADDNPAPVEEVVLEETGTESAEAAEHEVTCVAADIPLPTEAEATLRFTNVSGHEMVVNWRDTGLSPPGLVEYARVADGGTFDQESFAGHEWVMVDHDGNTLEYVVSAEPQQCVVLHHWTYEGETGPENWAELREEYEACAIGQKQSPIDLGVAGAADLENIIFAYGATPVNLLNNGHTIQVDKIVNNQITLGGVIYPLKQLHFHAPSEHVEGGEHYPLEMHLVHQLDTGELAVVGVLIAAGAENTAFAPVWNDLVVAASPAAPTGATVDVDQLLPADRQVYAYSGSLTTPPCKEEVKWFVMNEPIELSADQIAAFTAIISENTRPLQALNERALALDNTP